MRDLFKVLWCFERIEAARLGLALDEEMLLRLVGHHVLWWDELLQNVTQADVRSRTAVRDLARWAESRDPSLRAWAAADFGPSDEDDGASSQRPTAVSSADEG